MNDESDLVIRSLLSVIRSLIRERDQARHEQQLDRIALREAYRQIDDCKAQLDKERTVRGRLMSELSDARQMWKREVAEYKAELAKERERNDQLAAEFHNSGRWSPLELNEAKGCE